MAITYLITATGERCDAVSIGMAGWNGIVDANTRKIVQALNYGGKFAALVGDGDKLYVPEDGQAVLFYRDLTIDAGGQMEIAAGGEYMRLDPVETRHPRAAIPAGITAVVGRYEQFFLFGKTLSIDGLLEIEMDGDVTLTEA